MAHGPRAKFILVVAIVRREESCSDALDARVSIGGKYGMKAEEKYPPSRHEASQLHAHSM